MSTELVILAGAESDLLEHYVRLGDRFYERADQALERLKAFPQLAPVYSPPFRRLLIQHTNYGIFYVITGKRVIVSAVLDLRQDPEKIMRRLKPDMD